MSISVAFTKEDLSNHINQSKYRYKWLITTPGKTHEIESIVSLYSGQLRLYFNNKILFLRDIYEADSAPMRISHSLDADNSVEIVEEPGDISLYINRLPYKAYPGQRAQSPAPARISFPYLEIDSSGLRILTRRGPGEFGKVYRAVAKRYGKSSFRINIK